MEVCLDPGHGHGGIDSAMYTSKVEGTSMSMHLKGSAQV